VAPPEEGVVEPPDSGGSLATGEAEATVTNTPIAEAVEVSSTHPGTREPEPTPATEGQTAPPPEPAVPVAPEPEPGNPAVSGG
jgi:hypothetical protein